MVKISEIFSSSSDSSKEEMPGIIDRSRRANGSEVVSFNIYELVDDLQNRSPGQQLAIGGVTGWASGFITMKVGRWALITVGSALIVLQLASYKGYIEINWGNVQSSMEQAKRQIERELGVNKPDTSKISGFITRNMYLTGGLLGGFLLGLGSG